MDSNNSTNIYPFADLSNFWDHLKPKREERILRRIERKKQKGKIKRFNYRLLVHEIIQRDEEYIMIAEAYYPRYNYSSGNSVGAWNSFSRFQSAQFGNPYFLGYKYTHAVVVGFDRIVISFGITPSKLRTSRATHWRKT